LSVVDIEATFDGRWLNLRVTNLGLGVSRELGSRVFIPFARARMPAHPSMKGLGLGLPIAQRIVELHGGQIKVEQTTDHRTEVLLMLPTGVSPRTDPRLDIQQAQRYARDLAKVLARRTKRQPQPA
ncbi:MAG: ATP-binding protein, partial [Burkholderiales bacterium]